MSSNTLPINTTTSGLNGTNTSITSISTMNNNNGNSNNYIGIDFKIFENIEYPYCPDVNLKYDRVAKIGQGTFG